MGIVLTATDRVDRLADRTIVTIRLIDRVFQLGATLVKWAALVWIASYAAQAIGQLAGESTDATFSVVIEFVKRTGGGEFLWILIAVGGVSYGIIQKRLRRRAIEHFSSQVRELELALDPNRSSSELTIDGRTNPKDY